MMKNILTLFVFSFLLTACPDQRNSITGPTDNTDRSNGHHPPRVNATAKNEPVCYVHVSGLRKTVPCPVSSSASGAITTQ